MFVRVRAGVGLSALVAAAAGGVVVGSAPPALAASSPNPWPAHVFAPYVDTWTGNVTLTDVAANTGTKFFTIAFVDGTGCQWQIGEQSTMQSQIDSLRAQGGDVSISFGGYGSDTNLTELGDSCPTPEAAAAQIESVVTTFNVSHLDFDIESNSLTNGAGIDRRDKALAEVRSWVASNGRSLSISFTIPTNPGGLTQDGVNLLNNARANGFIPDVVNIMTMDYGSSGTEMGNAANQAIDAVAGQVSSAFGVSSSAAYAMLGNTPMIGQNDTPGEIFTLADASSVESYAASRGIALLSYWSENRDNGGCPGATGAAGNCSGLSQNTGDFARAFQPFTGTGGCTSNCGGGGTGPGQVTGYQGLCLDVRSANSADGTPVQVYTCNGTGAQSWTLTSGNQLQSLGKCLDVSGAGTANGTLVQLYTCNGTGAQVWQHQTNGEYLNPNSGKCLDDTAFGGSGTQAQIWACADSSNQQWSLPSGSSGGGGTGGFVVSETQFNQMFPNRNSFYTYSGLVSALSAYPAFATTGGTTVEKQEAAAFLANVDHETGGLVYINEIDQSGNYCAAESYGCPAGTYAYYGRGPLQISWNFNYKAAGDALGVDLLDNPNLVSTNAATSWETALWYWMTSTGGGSMTSHQAMVNGAGFGNTIRAINNIECNGGNTAEMQDRVNDYQSFTSILGVSPGGNLTC